MIYLKLFWSFFQIGLFSFGGGYAALPFIKHQVVSLHAWLDINEFSDIVAISQMTPGPVAINAATFVGTRIGGLTGSIVATLGCILPSCIIVIILSMLYMKYRNLSLLKNTLTVMRPCIVGLIGSAALSLALMSFFGTEVFSEIKSFDIVAFFIFALSFILIKKFKMGPMWIMLISCVAGLISYGVLDLI